MNSDFLQGFLNQAENSLPLIRNGILICSQTGNIYGELHASLHQTTSLKAAAEVIQIDEAFEIAEKLEEKLKVFAALKIPITDEQTRDLLDKVTELEAVIAHLRFNTEDFSIHVTDFVNESFENLGFYEAKVEISDGEEDEWTDDFDIDKEMLEIFGEEAEELVRNITANLKILEQNPNDRAALLEIRRNAHTLKGSAGIVGLKTLSEVAHRVEDLLDFIAENEIESDTKIFELLSIATDCFNTLASGEISAQLTKKINDLYSEFDVLLNALKAADEASKQSEISATLITAPVVVSSATSPNKSVKTVENQENFQQTVTDATKINADAAPNFKPEALNLKSVVRVSLEKLDDLVKIMSGLVVSRSVFEQRLSEFEQQISELHNSTRRLRQTSNKIETDFAADLNDLRISHSKLQVSHLKTHQSLSQSRIQQPFDSLELDRYTEFHQTTRELIETTGDTSAINAELDNLKSNLESLFENQRHLIEEMQDKLMRLRMVPFGSLTVRLQRTLRFSADEEQKSAELGIDGEELEVDTQILDSLIEPLLHLLRNAVAHGIEAPETRRLLGKSEVGKIKVSAANEGTHFVLKVSDDGRGICAASLKEKAIHNCIISRAAADNMTEQEAFELIFLAGLTTAEEISQIAGRGVGMDIVKNAVARQQGTISIKSEIHQGTVFTIRLPIALAVTRALLVRAEQQIFAFPLNIIEQIEQWSAVNNANPVFHLNTLLGLPAETISINENTPFLSLRNAENPCGLLVDEIIKPEEIIIKPLGYPLQQLKQFLGAIVLGNGSVVPVLDLHYLLKPPVSVSEDKNAPLTNTENLTNEKELTVLVVDDSPSVRHLTSNIIKNVGWTVIVAKDGLDALDVLHDLRELPDVILSDVEMPRMNGYELVASLNKQTDLQKIPVIMITSRANQKHRQKAFDLGVSEYLIKPFDDAKLIETIQNLTTE